MLHVAQACVLADRVHQVIVSQLTERKRVCAPCTLLFLQVPLSQVAAFQGFVPSANNARPLQPLNGRHVYYNCLQTD